MLQAKTQDIIPESGLGPQNSQWRRWVETSITNLKLGFTAFKADIANSFKAVSSSMELLTKQVKRITPYNLLDSKVMTFPSATFWPPQNGGSVVFDAVSSEVIITMSITGSINAFSNTAGYWQYTVSIPGVLSSGMDISLPPKNLISGGPVGGSATVPFSGTKSFSVTLPSPGAYTLTSAFRGSGNMSDEVVLDIISALTTIQSA